MPLCIIIGVGQGARGACAPQYFRRGGLAHPIIITRPSYIESSICNPVDSKGYWSIDKLVGFGQPNIFIFYSTDYNLITAAFSLI